MKLAVVFPRTLRTLADLCASAVRWKPLAPAALLAPFLLSSVLAEPCAAQRSLALSEKGPCSPCPPPPPPPPPPAPTQQWTGVGEAHYGFYLYRVKFAVQLYKKDVGGGQVESNGYVKVTSFQRKVFGTWKDVDPGSSGVRVSGSFSGPRSPSHYYLPNPFSNFSLGGLGTVQHFGDVGAPGFAMTNGVYTVTAYTPGNKPVTATITW